MKKLVYILVAVFTMISVNANAITYNLYFCYPGCDENKVNETIWVDSRTEYKNGTVFNESKEVIDWNLPTCKGYKFVGFYTKVDNSLRAKVIYPFEDGYVIKTASNADITIEVYGKWEKDTKNYKWNSDGSGFYYTYYDEDNEEWHKISLPWNHMALDTTTSINEVEVTSHSTIKEGIYTLNGVKVENITKSGIYIINGKKVMVK